MLLGLGRRVERLVRATQTLAALWDTYLVKMAEQEQEPGNSDISS